MKVGLNSDAVYQALDPQMMKVIKESRYMITEI
jgi:hypothetical protein